MKAARRRVEILFDCLRPLPPILLISFLLAPGARPALSGTPGDRDAPKAESPDTAGFDLESYRGRVVLLDFWASWCGPCKQSFPWMSEMLERYASEGLEIVAVDVDRDPEAAAKFLAATRPPFRIVPDPGGKLAEAWKLEAMPSSFLYDRSGKQRFSHLGFREEEKGHVETEIRTLLAEAGPDSAAG